MSYADVTAHNAPPPSMQVCLHTLNSILNSKLKNTSFFFSQPKPDPALLNTEQPKSGIVADDTAKVNIVSPDFKRDPTTVTSEKHPIEDVSESDGEDNTRPKINGKGDAPSGRRKFVCRIERHNEK